MPTLLIKNVPEDVLRELKHLKVELGCRSWSELLQRLLRPEIRGEIEVPAERMDAMRKGVRGFLALRERVSKKWPGRPSVLAEFRRGRAHE